MNVTDSNLFMKLCENVQDIKKLLEELIYMGEDELKRFKDNGNKVPEV